MFLTFFQGFAVGFTLILAIGAQNAFVLRQGLRRSHVFWVCLTCALIDAVLIVSGVKGFGALAQRLVWLETLMRYGGALFLVVYGAQSALSAWRGGQALDAAAHEDQGLRATLLTLLALSLLNPHVYLDTLVLIGSIAAQYPDKAAFGLGAVSASFIFFFSLGYGARLLQPFFAKPRSWQILDAGIALIMFSIAFQLLSHG